ncbi:MAG TPA: AAA family ATPase, partial [Methanoculleus sp.]|nr:AAA family ATPase [Methanoculleus sp.]
MANTESVEVTIKEAAHEDAGRGIARLSIDTMKVLGLVSGDVVEVEGRQKAATLIWPGFPQDTGKAILRIDGSTRSNVGAGIDD